MKLKEEIEEVKDDVGRITYYVLREGIRVRRIRRLRKPDITGRWRR